MKLEPPRPSTRMVVVGKTGTGKSYRVKEIVRGWLDRGVRVVAIDVCDEYSRQAMPRGGSMTAEGPLRQRATLAQVVANPALLKDARLSLAVVPNDLHSPRAMAHTFLVVEQMLRAIGKPTVIVVDEVGRWTNPGADTGKPNKCHLARIALEGLATTGRKDGVALVTVSQSAAHIPANVRRQSDEWLAFLQDDPTDLEAMTDRLGKEKAAEVSCLGRFQFVHWRDATHAATPTRLKAV